MSRAVFVCSAAAPACKDTENDDRAAKSASDDPICIHKWGANIQTGLTQDHYFGRLTGSGLRLRTNATSYRSAAMELMAWKI